MRIIGQCNAADFAEIEHLASVLDKPESLDVSTLKRKQVLAFGFAAAPLIAGSTDKATR